MITLDELLRPFEFQFFQNGLVVATVAGALCGLIGVYVVLRSMSYIGHGLSHAIFGGFAVSALAGVNVFLGAGLWGLASALAVSSVTRRRPIGSDAAIGVITTASFAFGLAVLQLGGGADVDADAALFGNVLGVTRGDVWIVSGVTLFAIAVIVLRYRSLLFVTFDPEVAEASGVKVARIDALLMLVLAASILATMNVMGVTLIAAALVVPAVVARMVTSSFSTMLWLSTLIGAVCGFVGMNLSYHLDVASGPTIVLVGGALFVGALAVTGVRGRTRLAGVDAH
ncbi:metal ABC transporter permease [Acidimicrobiia bacterium EGI L10123]|uniref:metal ABC transporter permease n=1 Tax=Salinilacustrithrix flava TaxID=2957203 RepID=UPI003D7C1C19|nr:metal ABC transporter permease [Acidimicrobiia bacterium EGI L10123]